ncbi:branched-chain amino acid ABC transporter permease [Natronorarus salvus]|uniref:branched-chain amino acid ABC transporter permease n=1 Tax=Natronorarus salvus TaxID=3117733 RepID=UPI002F269C47
MCALQLVADGVIFSCIIVLGAIGLSLVYNIANFPNFAHGDLMAVGAFGAITANTVLGLPFVVAAIVGIGVGAAVGVATERVVFEPLDVGPLELLIASIGVALCYRAVLITGFGSDPRSYDVGGRGRVEVLHEATGIAASPRSIAIVASTVVLVLSLHLLLQYTSLGRKMRATADDPDLARVSGIRTRTVTTAMWVIGGGLAAAGGVFLGLDTIVRPQMGFDILLVLFAAVILGGIGSVYGAMLGGFAIGMAHELTPLVPGIGTEYKAAVAFVIMILILLFRPSGIMGGKESA